jgi:hypothetical protein
MGKRVRLAEVANPEGRVDVLLYQIVSRVVDRIEQDKGLVGLREYVLPIVEDAIVQSLPARNLIPREIAAVLKVCELNRGRLS